MTLFGQKIELFGGPDKNIFHDYDQNQSHFSSAYKSGLDFTAGIGVDSVKIDWLTMRFTLQFSNYGGELEASDGGLGSMSTTKAKINKSVISLGIFPLNCRIFHRIDLNFGLEISRLIGEKFSGTSSGWMMGRPDWSYDLHDQFKRYSSLVYFGFRGKISYDLFLSKSIIIFPQYSYYFGLSNEFDQFPETTKSMRHSFCIGIKRKLK
jgi:hypothetical protein